MTGRSGPARRGRDGGRGQSLAEFALVAPIFFLLVFFVIQLGLVMAAQNGLVDGVRSAARRVATYRVNEGSFDASSWGAICTTVEDEIATRLRTRVIGFNGDNLTATITYEWKQNPDTTEYFLVAHVSALYANQLYVPLVSTFLDNSDGFPDERLTLSASEQMRIENPPLDAPTTTAPPC